MRSATLIILFIHSAFFAAAQKTGEIRSIETALNEEYSSGIFKTTDGTVIPVEGTPGINSYINILNFLQGRVAGLRVQTTRNNILIPVIRGQQATLFVDELQVTPGYLSALPVSDIAMAKIFKTPLSLSPNNAPAIAIYLIRPAEKEE